MEAKTPTFQNNLLSFVGDIYSCLEKGKKMPPANIFTNLIPNYKSSTNIWQHIILQRASRLVYLCVLFGTYPEKNVEYFLTFWFGFRTPLNSSLQPYRDKSFLSFICSSSSVIAKCRLMETEEHGCTF